MCLVGRYSDSKVLIIIWCHAILGAGSILFPVINFLSFHLTDNKKDTNGRSWSSGASTTKRNIDIPLQQEATAFYNVALLLQGIFFLGTGLLLFLGRRKKNERMLLAYSKSAHVWITLLALANVIFCVTFQEFLKEFSWTVRFPIFMVYVALVLFVELLVGCTLEYFAWIVRANRNEICFGPLPHFIDEFDDFPTHYQVPGFHALLSNETAENAVKVHSDESRAINFNAADNAPANTNEAQ